MKRFIIIPLLMIILLVSGCNSQQVLPVTHVRDMGAVPVSQGFFYMLPRTVATIDIAVTRTESTPGPYADYAGRYLGLDDIIHQPVVRYEITNVNISSYSEPDPAHAYFVPFNALQNREAFVSLSESGLIQSVNVPFDQQEFRRSLNETQQYGFFGNDITFNHFMDHNLQERIDTIRERVYVDTLAVERQTLRRSWVEKSTDIRAREVADYIIRIRNKKFEIITGFAEIPYSKEALEYMYTELNEMEEDYLKLFRGISSESTINYRFTIVPDATTRGASRTLFRFSPREGIIEANRQEGYPVSLEMRPSQAASVVRAMPPGQQETGLFYRIPEYATAVLREGNIIRAETRMLVNQFGAISRMAPQGMQLEFHPNTGSLKTIGSLNQSGEN